MLALIGSVGLRGFLLFLCRFDVIKGSIVIVVIAGM